MFKYGTLILGLGLAVSLASCDQTPASAPALEKAATPEVSKSETPRTREGREGRPQSADGAREGRRTPPESAFAACNSVAIGASCSFETPRGARTGVCRTRGGDDRAFCAGARPERSQGGRPARSEGSRPDRPNGGRPGGRGQE